MLITQVDEWARLVSGCTAPNPTNPRPITPNIDPALHPARNPGATLVERLSVVVDHARQLATDLGARPYRIWSVVYEWSGGERGRGTPTLLAEVELLPTPVLDQRSLTSEGHGAGTIIRGDARLREISPRYTEDQVRALVGPWAMAPRYEPFLESRIDARDGLTMRRRWQVSGVPYRETDDGPMGWTAKLVAQDQARDRTGMYDRPSVY